MRRTASEVPATPIEIAKSRSTVNEGPCGPDESSCGPDEGPGVAEEELEDENAVPDVPVVPVLMLVCVCDVEEIVDEVSEESRTSKLSRHIQSIFPVSRKMTNNLHEHINDSKLSTSWDSYINRMFLIHSTGPMSNYI